MHWYGGSIAEAVALSKQKNTIFVVFIEGDNDLSQEMSSTIDSTVILSRLSNEADFLAIKLKSGSTNYTHFAQIYQFVPVPSLFFIGRNGTPLEVVCAGVDSENLATRIDRILEEHRKEKPSPTLVQPSTSKQNVKEQTVNLLKSEGTSQEPLQATKTKTEATEDTGPAPKMARTDDSQDYEVVCDGDVCVRRPRAKAEDPGPSKDSAPPVEDSSIMETEPTLQEPVKTTEPTESETEIEDKLEKAKQLIEARRREKEDKEKELEKQKEMERRATGKGVTELKKWQAEQELKQIQEERKREKLENNLARQRILEQIAQDRAERRARDVTQPVETRATTPQGPGTSGDASTVSRIQFKLPDGTSHSAQFEATSTIADLHTYIVDNIRLQPSSFTLWTAFPRRELTSGPETLGTHGLSPSGAVLVLPNRAVAPSPAITTSFSTVIAFLTTLFSTVILQPSQQLYQWIRSRIFPPETARSPGTPPASRQTPPGLRRRGNVHRLPGDSGNNDDNNTWNGNSTQQM